MRSLFFIFCLFFIQLGAQDSAYARRCIKYLTSEKCFGRGYLKNGLKEAEKFIVAQIKEHKALPLFKESYIQAFTHPVNTFPSTCKVLLNGRLLQPGADYILDPSAIGMKGKFTLKAKDSVTYVAQNLNGAVMVKLKNKLTYSVGHEELGQCIIELNRKTLNEKPRELEVKIKNKLVKSFRSNNIACYINGTSGSDSVIVFSAHYDHLGGMSAATYFPGANDNASGTSLLLNLIKHYSLNPPRLKTVFVFFAAEEAGLVGSGFLVKSGALELTKIKFLINLDLLGTGDDGIMVVNGAIHQNEFALLQSINAEKNLVKEIKKRGKAANSDHYWFSEAGVPCFFIYTMGGISAYHDIYDIEKTLPLTDYVDVFKLLTEFVGRL